MSLLSQTALDQIFVHARSVKKFKPDAVSDDTLRQLHELMKWGPTAFNSQPARFVFLRSTQAKARLKPALIASNVDKTMAAPVVVIVAMDMLFYEHLPQLNPATDAKSYFVDNAALTETSAFRNSSLQGAYLMVAARMLGLGCGPMSGFDAAKVNAEFFADGRLKANFLINLGYGDPSGNYPRGPRLSFDAAARLL
jgi:3-hydroxypropanoate dehydrogenase